MEMQNYIRKPFEVYGVEITESNIAEVAELVGTLKTTDEGVVYIALNRRLIPNVGRAYIGWFVTQMGDNFRIYSPKIFTQEFVVKEGQLVTFNFNAGGVDLVDLAIELMDYGAIPEMEVFDLVKGEEENDDPNMGLAPDAAEVRADKYTLVMTTREEAEHVLTAMKDICIKFNVVLVADLHDLVGLPHKYNDTLLGWNEMVGAQIRLDAAGWILSLPKPMPFETPAITSHGAQRTEVPGPAGTPPIDSQPGPGKSPLD